VVLVIALWYIFGKGMHITNLTGTISKTASQIEKEKQLQQIVNSIPTSTVSTMTASEKQKLINGIPKSTLTNMTQEEKTKIIQSIPPSTL
jgi:hypothetical protein